MNAVYTLILMILCGSVLGQTGKVNVFGLDESKYPPNKKHRVVIEVQDAESKKTLDKARLGFITKPQTYSYDSILKRFFVEDINFLQDGSLYVNVAVEGYQSKVVNINRPSDGVAVFMVVSLVKILQKGAIITLKTIQFDQSEAYLKPKSFVELDNLVNTLKENNALKIEIRGHTDNVGDATLNQKLSEKRCEAVKDYLVEKGIEPQRLSIKGFGGSRPLVSNDTENNRIKNRRVEFFVVE